MATACDRPQFAPKAEQLFDRVDKERRRHIGLGEFVLLCSEVFEKDVRPTSASAFASTSSLSSAHAARRTPSEFDSAPILLRVATDRCDLRLELGSADAVGKSRH